MFFCTSYRADAQILVLYSGTKLESKVALNDESELFLLKVREKYTITYFTSPTVQLKILALQVKTDNKLNSIVSLSSFIAYFICFLVII